MFACFFFFKQKTAYEMRISDWSSDVCSSDLAEREIAEPRLAFSRRVKPGAQHQETAANIVVIARHFHTAIESGPGFAVIAAGAIGRASCRERVCQYV